MLDTALGFLKPSSGVNVESEVVVGDKEEAVNTDVRIAEDATEISAETVTTNKTEINEGASWWMVGLLILGWVLPSPAQMWKHILHLLHGNKK
jgi:hypothetical protein